MAVDTEYICPFSMSGATPAKCLHADENSDPPETACYAWVVDETQPNDGYCKLIETRAAVVSTANDIIEALGDESDAIIDSIETLSDDVTTSITNESVETRKRMVGEEAAVNFEDDDESLYLAKYSSILPLLKYIRHEHDNHMHIRPHIVNEYLYEEAAPEYPETGSNFGPSYSPSVVLMQEYISNMDLDGNGLIYGKDFKIKNSDSNKPYMLEGLESQPAWRNPPSQNNKDWDEYLAEINWTATLPPATVNVPFVTGSTEELALLNLTNLGLNSIVNEIYDDLIAAGIVIQQFPVGGTSVYVGTTVILNVSLGVE